MKRMILGALVGALALALFGCTIRRYPNATYGAPAPRVRQEPPQVETRQIGERRIEFHSAAIPPATGGHEIKLGARPVSPQSIADLDRRLAGQTDLRVWHSPQRLYCKVQQAGGKWVEGWLPAGTQLLARREGERNGIVLWRVLEVARCGNPVDGVMIREISPRTETTIREREVVEQPYPVREPAPAYYELPRASVWWGWGSGGYYRHKSNVHIRRHRDVHIRRHHRR